MSRFSKLKGQYMSFDAIIGALIFMIIFILIISYWQSLYSKDKIEIEILNQESIRISSILLSNDRSFSILSGDCVDPKRLSSLNVRKLSNYGVYITLKPLSNIPMFTAAGSPYSSKNKLVAHTTRLVDVCWSHSMRSMAFLEVYVYK